MTNTAYWMKESGKRNNYEDMPSDAYEIETRLTKSVYNFEHNKYTTAYNNSLNYNNVKNDFVVWGYRKSINSNIKIPCRFHLAVDKKQTLFESHNVAFFKDEFKNVRGIDYENDFKVGDTVKWLDVDYKIIQIDKDRTAIDWRQQIYYQMLEDERKGTGQNTQLNNTYFQYYAELKEQFPKIFDLLEQKYKIDLEKNPDQINYYLDFIDENSQLGGYSVNNIGRRAKIIDDNNQGINCVFEPTIPDVVYISSVLYSDKDLIALERKLINIGQDFTQIEPRIYNLFDVGGQLNSCFEKIKDLLYQYTHVNNTISITTLPIYYLEPNTRITVEDSPSGVYGDYIIQSISLPLDISSTMTINASKALSKI